MTRPIVFTGSLVVDLIEWGLGGQLFGLIAGYLYAEGYNYVAQSPEPLDVVWFSARQAARLATLGIAVALWGHLFVAIFY